MERTCTAITSNDKDAVMHLEIYAPEDKSNLKLYSAESGYLRVV